MKLPRLQLHLTTCIVLMFVAGGLLWLNFSPSELTIDIHEEDASPSPLVYAIEKGWPWHCYTENLYDLSPIWWRWNQLNLILNSLIALAILAAVAALSERLIRRRRKI